MSESSDLASQLVNPRADLEGVQPGGLVERSDLILEVFQSPPTKQKRLWSSSRSRFWKKVSLSFSVWGAYTDASIDLAPELSVAVHRIHLPKLSVMVYVGGEGYFDFLSRIAVPPLALSP